MLLFAPYLMFFCSVNVTNIPAVLQPSSTCCQRFTHQPIVFCVVGPTRISLGLAMRSVSLFSTRAAALVSRVSRLRRSTFERACTPLTKSEEKDRLGEKGETVRSLLYDRKRTPSYSAPRDDKNINLLFFSRFSVLL